MQNNSRKNYRKRKPKNKILTEEKYELVGSNILLKSCVQFLDSVDDYSAQTFKLQTTPSISLYDNGNKIIIDYSHSKNKDDLENIKKIFNINIQDEFTITDAYWECEEADSINANFSGTFSFNGLENDNIIIATPKTTITTSDGVVRYSPTFFDEIPQIKISSGSSTKKISIIKNILGFQSEKSFRNMGVNHREKNIYEIEIIGSNSNTSKYKIHEYKIAVDGSEELILTDQITEEITTTDGYFLINIYVKLKNKKKMKTLTSTRMPGEGSCFSSLLPDDCFYSIEEVCRNIQGEWYADGNCKKKSNIIEQAETSPLSNQIRNTNNAIDKLVQTLSFTGNIAGGNVVRREPFNISGFYPLYSSKESSDASSPNNSGSMQHIIHGKVYYMPNGLKSGVTQFHGEYKPLSSTTTRSMMQSTGSTGCTGPPATGGTTEEQMKCCECLLYSEAGGADMTNLTQGDPNTTDPCMWWTLWVMYNRRKDPVPGGAIPGNAEITSCAQANTPAFSGGWNSERFKNCYCDERKKRTSKAEQKRMKKASELCRKIGINNYKPHIDPTGGANYFFRCDSVPDWMQCNIDSGVCSKVTGPAGCNHCFYKCNSIPRPCPPDV
jgi:hypothetical protein